MRGQVSGSGQVHGDHALPGLDDAIHGSGGDSQVILLGGECKSREFGGVLCDTEEISQRTQCRDHDGTGSPQADLAGNIRLEAHRET